MGVLLRPVSAALMAGGRSTRMGRDKAFLEFHGQPLWRVQAEKLKLVAAEVLISVGDRNFPLPPETQAVADRVPGRGPLEGLAAVLRVARHDHVVALAVDMPGMTSDYLLGLVEHCAATQGVVPELDGFYQGLCAVYPKGILALVEEALRGSDRSFQGLIPRACAAGLLEVVPVPEHERHLFRNWNSVDAMDAR